MYPWKSFLGILGAHCQYIEAERKITFPLHLLTTRTRKSIKPIFWPNGLAKCSKRFASKLDIANVAQWGPHLGAFCFIKGGDLLLYWLFQRGVCFGFSFWTGFLSFSMGVPSLSLLFLSFSMGFPSCFLLIRWCFHPFPFVFHRFFFHFLNLFFFSVDFSCFFFLCHCFFSTVFSAGYSDCFPLFSLFFLHFPSYSLLFHEFSFIFPAFPSVVLHVTSLSDFSWLSIGFLMSSRFAVRTMHRYLVKKSRQPTRGEQQEQFESWKMVGF